MPKVICTVREHGDSGCIGLVPDKYLEWFNKDYYIPGYRLSHELLEHIDKNEVGSVENELAALGARLYVGQFFDHYSFSFASLENGFTQDMYNALNDGQFENVNFCPNAKFPKLSLRDDIDRLDNVFEYCYSRLKDTIQENPFDLEEGEGTDDYLANNKEAIKNWLYFGYRRASKKYSKYGAYDIFCLGQEIDRQCETLNKQNELFEGQKVIVSYTFSTGKVNVELIEDEY